MGVPPSLLLGWHAPLLKDGTSFLDAAAQICHQQVNMVFPSRLNSSPYLVRNVGCIL